MTEPAPSLRQEGKTSVDYLRKLHQQLVQKDNIIKLLQVQLKNLERGGHADSDASDAALAESEDRMLALEAELQEAQAELAGTRSRMIEAESELTAARAAARKAERLEAATSLKDEELARYREMLRNAEQEGDDLSSAQAEVSRLEQQLTESEETIAKLERDLGRARERAVRQGSDPAELRELRDQVADLEAALEVARRALEAEAEGVTAGDRFPLQQSVIEMLQVLDDYRSEIHDEVDTVGLLEVQLSELREQLNLERIETTGHRYDPEVHAVGRVVYSDEGEHETVVAEEVAGYFVGERVVKQAQVTILRNPYQCSGCGEVGVAGAAFCHVCGERIVAREDSGQQHVGRPRDEARKLLDIAKSYHRKGDSEAAREKVELALAMAPEDPKVLVEAARLDEDEGRFDLALLRLSQVPDRVPGLKGLGAFRARLAAKAEIVDTLKGLQ